MENNPMLEVWNSFMIFLVFIIIIALLALVIWALGLSIYEFCLAHTYLWKKCFNKCCSCCRKSVDKSTIVPITQCDLVYGGKTPSGNNEYNAKVVDISSIKIML